MRQDGTLRRAPSEKRRALSPLARAPAEKKKRTLVKRIKIQSPVPSSSSTSTPTAPDSPAPAYEDVSSSFGRDPNDLGASFSIPELEPLALSIVEKPAAKKPTA